MKSTGKKAERARVATPSGSSYFSDFAVIEAEKVPLLLHQFLLVFGVVSQ